MLENLLPDLVSKMDYIIEKLNKIDEEVQLYGHRLERLEKMDSIEHRVTVNQIDLSDIKEIVEKVADLQQRSLVDLSKHIANDLKHSSIKEEINLIHKRLDVQLNKIAKTEEAILLVGNKK